ncbi:MAG: sigma-70 family RNA polymerase sigma factor [Ruminococcaceae bacterium]|nr:sigma-70 family RNA polymerase sigma factor [Oscillospiraceae bacterium]
MILGEMRRYVRDNNSVRVPRSLRDLAYKALQVKEKLAFLLGREPTVEEIAKETGAEKEEIINALDAITEPISLYEPVYSDTSDSVYILDQIKDSVNTDDSWVNTIALSQAIDKLEQREKRILAMRFFRGKTQTEVADEIGISQAQVSRIEKNALTKVRNRL